MKSIIHLFCLGLFSLLFSQNPAGYAQKVVEVLSSKELAGRGYTHHGLQKAEKEISSQFQKIGLLPFNGNYLQEVSYPINVIESSTLKINGKTLEFGKDYILSGFSKTGKGKSSAAYFDKSVVDSTFIYQETDDLYNEIEKLEGKAVVFDTVNYPPNYVNDGYTAFDMYRDIKYAYDDAAYDNDNKVILEMSPNKLTMGLSETTKNTYHFTIKSGSIRDSIREVEYDVTSHFDPDFKTHNIIGYIPGRDTSKKVIVSAHYDHLGQIDDVIFAGANDNASGVALLLSLAKYFKENTPKYTVVFVAFTGEEAGLKGSQYFVKHPPFDLNEVKMVFNFDIVGTGNEGIQIVNSSKYPMVYNELIQINRKHTLLPQIKKRGESCNSDHCPFDQAGIPALFTYTLGGAPYYHDIDDTAENLSLKKFNEVFYLFATYIGQEID